MKTGIVGVGFVGGALATVLDKPYLYDPYKDGGIGSKEEINEADVIFICVPTPYNEKRGGFDISAVLDALSWIEGEKVVVVKSTVVPGTTEMLQEKYPQHKILFNPEFLVEKTAVEDMQNPERQIVGYTKKSRDMKGRIMDLLPRAPYKASMPATEAELVKYFGNAFLSVRVIFANQMYDLCERLGADYELVKNAAAADKRIGASHFDIFHDGYRGYAGKCLPKDTRALIQKGRKAGAPLELLEIVDRINNQLRESGHRFHGE